MSKNNYSPFRYTFIGLIMAVLISFFIMYLIVQAANIKLSTESISYFISEHSVVFLLVFVPGVVITFVGYFADLSLKSRAKAEQEDSEDTQATVQEIYEFVEKLRKRESLADYIERPDNDKIIQSLIRLSEEMQTRQEKETVRKKEEAQRTKTSEGLAYFGAVLREHNNSIEELTQFVTNELVRYVDAYQAAFYLIEEKNGEKIIKEAANYAAGRKRFASKELKWGESLPGACILEKKTNYLKNISEDYIEIESGLGQAKPKSLLLLPVVTLEGVIHGAIELAAFKEYEEYEVKFLEQVAENTALTISTLKINNETAILLEESREQAKALSSREDELRKTISDMKRLQKNADIQSAAFKSYQNSANRALVRAEFSNDGKLLFANNKFLDLLEYQTNTEIEGADMSKFINADNFKWFDTLKKTVIEDKAYFEGLIKYLSKSGKTHWMQSVYIGSVNETGEVDKILFWGIDSSKLKNNLLGLEANFNQFKQAFYSIEFLQTGQILDVGKNLSDKLNYKNEELSTGNFFKLLSTKNAEIFEDRIVRILQTREAYEGEFEFINSQGLLEYFYGTIFVQKDLNRNISILKLFAYDYSQQINASKKIQEQDEFIQAQIKEIDTIKERMNRRIENVRDEMRELNENIEIAHIFSQKVLELYPEIVISIDKNNLIRFMNNEATAFFDTKNEHVEGKNIQDLFPEIQGEVQENYLRYILNIDNADKLLGANTEVYCYDAEGKTQKFRMIVVNVAVGLRKQLTVFLKKI